MSWFCFTSSNAAAITSVIYKKRLNKYFVLKREKIHYQQHSDHVQGSNIQFHFCTLLLKTTECLLSPCVRKGTRTLRTEKGGKKVWCLFLSSSRFSKTSNPGMMPHRPDPACPPPGVPTKFSRTVNWSRSCCLCTRLVPRPSASC